MIMDNNKLYEKGFEDKHNSKHKGEWDAWFISDFLALIGGVITCTSKNYIEAEADNYTKRICLYMNDRKFVAYISLDDFNKYSYTNKDYLAFEGFCARYNLQFEEWCDD